MARVTETKERSLEEIEADLQGATRRTARRRDGERHTAISH
jgi:hypothetical protein